MSQPGAAVDFLGYTFKRTAKGRLIRFPRQKSVKRFRESIKALTKRTSGKSLTETIKHTNRIARGWYNYFSESISNTFDEADGFVRRRLRAMLLKRRKTPRFGTSEAHRLWPNQFFAESGLFSMTAAHLSASNPARR